MGWSAFLAGEQRTTVTQPFPTNAVRDGIYSAGTNGEADRTMALGNTSVGGVNEFVFEATVSGSDVAALRLMFDLEVWAGDPFIALDSGEASFDVTINVPDSDNIETLYVETATTGATLTPPNKLGGTDNLFVQATSTFAANTLVSLASADFDGDGNLDVVGVGTRDNVFRVLFADGNNGFPRNATLETNEDLFDRTFGKRSVVTADLDGDDHIDISVIDRHGISIFQNIGDGTFASPIVVPSTDPLVALLEEDIDRDGDVDLVLLTESEALQKVVSLLNDGTGSFSEPASIAEIAREVSTRTRAKVLFIGDVTGDGWTDVVTAQFGVGRLMDINRVTVGVKGSTLDS